jgi:GAF domain-containing protein
VAKDAARAVVSMVASVVKPRAEIAAEHNKAWWRRTIVEIAALFLIVVPVELGLTGSVGSFEFHPHPYWLIVIPMACARGVVAGLLAAGIASMLYAAGALAALDEKSLSEIFEFEYMLEPILFFIVGFFCGELHDELASRFKRLERRMDDVQDRNQSLRQERDVLRDANRELEKRIVDASVQFGNLIVAAERIESSGRAELFEVALELVEEHCGASSSVVLMLEDGTLDYFCTRGWPDEEVADRLAATRESRLVRTAISDGRTVNGFSEDEEPPPSGPLVVAPLFDRSGLVKAMLCLDEIPVTRLNESTITTFLGIAKWIGAALSRVAMAERAETSPLSLPGGPSLQLGTVGELGDRLRLELERCARYGIATSFLAIQLTQWSDASREGRLAADRFAAEQFTGGLRPSDNLYRFGYPGCYLLVLAGTDAEGAGIVRDRLLRRVEFAATRAIGPVDIFATGPDADAPDLVSLAERVATRFRSQATLPLEGGCPIDVPDRGEPGTRAELLTRLRMEVSLAVRNKTPLQVVGFRTNARDVVVSVTLARHLSEVGTRLLRATDGVYLAQQGRAAIVMPVTGADEARALANRLVAALRVRDPHATYGSLETYVVGLDDAHPDVHAILESIGVSLSPEGTS